MPVGEAMPNLCCTARGYSILDLAKSPKMDLLVDECNARPPLPAGLVPTNSIVPAGVVVSHLRVTQIHRIADLPKIHPSVIAAYSIYMVDLFVRPLTSHHRPHDTMRFSRNSKKMARPVTAAIHTGKGGLSGKLRIPYFSLPFRRPVPCYKKAGTALPPSKLTSFRVVLKKLVQHFRIGQSLISHSVSPHVRGQGRALLTQRFRPVSYGGFTLCSQVGEHR